MFPMANLTTWKVDPAHSSIEFSVKHMMITTVRGRFKDFSATARIDEDDPNRSAVEVVIQAASIDTGAPDRDTHLRSADFFDVEKFPTLTFRSKTVEGAHKVEGEHLRITGDLQIRDTTIEIPLDVIYEGSGADPWGNRRAGITVNAEIDRRDWGLKWNQAIETGGVLVANKVRIQSEVQCVREAQAAHDATEDRHATAAEAPAQTGEAR
jgi:polyisoprenoid-binding protein YceI